MNSTLAGERRRVPVDQRQGRPEVRPVVQVTCELVGETADSAAQAARMAILNWLRDKQRISGLPEAAWEGVPFEIDAAQDRPVAVESFENVWAMRYDNPEGGPHGRIWRTEAIVGVQEQAALLGVRLTTITREWDVPIFRSVPKIISDLAESPGLMDYGVPLRGEPWRIESDRDVEEFVQLLENPGRTRPVYAVSADAGGYTLLDVAQLASRTAGLAHVAVISEDASRSLSHLLGNRLSVFRQAVRTYRRGFDRTDALFEEHPIATGDWLSRRFPDPRYFVTLLANQAIDATVINVDLETRLPSFGKVRDWVLARRLDAARREKAPEALQLQLYEESNRSLEEALRARDEDIEALRMAQLELEEARDGALRIGRSLRARIAFLEHALSARNVAEPVEYPESYDDLDDWASRHLGDRLVLLSRAARAAKKAEFEDLRLVCDALQLLAGPYRDMKLGNAGKPAFDQACGALGLELSLSGEASILLYPNEYFVSFGGQRRALELHLKKGTSREARNCLRIYFFWDDDADQVVVGHLPGHLTTAAS